MKPGKMIFAILMTLLLAGPASDAGAGAFLSDLENALMCTCDDKCGKVLVNCTCSTAEKTRMEFSRMLESGLTVQAIIQKQVDQYGETILSAPTKSGFNLTAWMTPFIALLAGGFGISKILDVWKARSGKKPRDSEETKTPENQPGKYSSRLQEELDKIEL